MNRRLLGVVMAAAAIAVLVAVPALGRDAVAPTFDRKASAGALVKAKRALNKVWLKVKDCDGAECSAALPPSLATGPSGNRGNTQAYWSKLRRWYSW